jgi:hypothetical protein
MWRWVKRASRGGGVDLVCVTVVLGRGGQTWEFGMMMGGEPHYMEIFLRNALSLPSQPVVLMLDPGEPSKDPDRTKQADRWVLQCHNPDVRPTGFFASTSMFPSPSPEARLTHPSAGGGKSIPWRAPVKSMWSWRWQVDLFEPGGGEVWSPWAGIPGHVRGHLAPRVQRHHGRQVRL